MLRIMHHTPRYCLFFGFKKAEMDAFAKFIGIRLPFSLRFCERNAWKSTCIVRGDNSVSGVISLADISKVYNSVVGCVSVDMVNKIWLLSGVQNPCDTVGKVNAPKELAVEVPSSVFCGKGRLSSIARIKPFYLKLGNFCCDFKVAGLYLFPRKESTVRVVCKYGMKKVGVIKNVRHLLSNLLRPSKVVCTMTSGCKGVFGHA